MLTPTHHSHLGAAQTLRLEGRRDAHDAALHHEHGHARQRRVAAVGTEQLRVVVAHTTCQLGMTTPREAVATAAGVYAQLRDALTDKTLIFGYL